MNLCQNFSMPNIPFTLIKPDQCLATDDYKTVHQGLDRLKIISGIALCTGEPGSGKTCAVSSWVETLNPNSIDVYWIEDAGRSVASFLKRTAKAMNIEPAYQPEKVYQELIAAIEQHHRDTRKKLIFVIDEAQQLPPLILEQIRFLTNLGQKHPVPISFILIAHREFLFTLKQHTMTALRRRIVISVSLEGLTRDEITPYLKHHIQIAGGPDGIFYEQAADFIFNQSRGVLRLINNIALSAMCKAAKKQQPRVGQSELTQVINECGEI
ncbi:MAG: ExeA family protein [Nitrospinota bacterium]